MAKTYKITKEWSDGSDQWFWRAYVKEEIILGWTYWNSLNIVENTKEDAEEILRKYIVKQAIIEDLKKESPEEYIVEG